MKKKTLSMTILSVVLISVIFSPRYIINIESPDEITYVDICVEEATQLLIRSQGVTILDVRTRVEYESGHIAGAKSIPLSELEERIDELDRDGTIIVNCKSGVRSRNASNILVNHGFENVYNLLGGINAWVDAGFSVVSDSTTDHSGQGCPCDSKGSATSPVDSSLSSTSVIETPLDTISPTVNISASPDVHSAHIGMDYTFTASLSGGPWGSSISYSWLIDYDGSNPDCPADQTATGQSVSAEVVCNGSHTVSVSVTDELGNTATDSYPFTGYTQEQLKEQAKSKIQKFLDRYKTECFNAWISLGDMKKVETALGKVEIVIDPIFLDSRKAVACYCHYDCIPQHYKDIVLRDKPDNVDEKVLWHEVMHAIFSDLGIVPSKQNTWIHEYMLEVESLLETALWPVEKEIKLGKNCDCNLLKEKWQRFVDKMENVKVISDGDIIEIRAYTGFDVDVDIIRIHYEAGDCEQCVTLENAICGDHDEDGIGSACDNSPCGDNAYLSDCTCECDEGYGNCNGDWSDGCEVNLNKARNNCGSCGNVCPENYYDDLFYCDLDDLWRDREFHIFDCDGGICTEHTEHEYELVETCSYPYTCCFGHCVNTNTNPNYCGSCLNVCPVGWKCCDGSCQECCADADCDDGDCCTDDKCEYGDCQNIDITWEVCEGVTCPEGEYCVCQCGSPVCVSDIPEFPLGVEVATGIGLMVAVVYIWLRKRKTKPTVAKHFTTKTSNVACLADVSSKFY